MNINCWRPGTEYYYLATLRQAADAMIARGCRKAYTLDGGQTATTVFHGELINPVQFGWEKEISDVIYFASAKSAEVKYVPWYELDPPVDGQESTESVPETADIIQEAVITSG